MIYLNNAATSWPKPESVYTSLNFHTRSFGAGFGRGNDKHSEISSGIIYDCRCAAAGLFGINCPERIIFTQNATDSINMALKGLLKNGDHVIVSSTEHNSVMRPLVKMKNSGIIDYSVADCSTEGKTHPESIRKLIQKNTALVSLIHTSNVTGTTNDIEAIGNECTKAGIPFMVDASQSAGIYDIDVIRDGISILAMPGHKGLLGPQGTGLLYIAPSINPDTIREGGTGSFSKNLLQPDDLPDKLESGTQNFPAIAALLEGIRFINKMKTATIRSHLFELTEMIRTEFRRISAINEFGDTENPSSIFSFNIDGIDTSEIGTYLADKDISVRGGFHCSFMAHKHYGTLNSGMIRISPGIFTVSSEIQSFIKILKKIF